MGDTPRADAARRGDMSDALSVGTAVLVRTRYLGSWASGFEVAERGDDGYRLRRLSDGSLLAQPVRFDDVRPEVDGA